MHSTAINVLLCCRCFSCYYFTPHVRNSWLSRADIASYEWNFQGSRLSRVLIARVVTFFCRSVCIMPCEHKVQYYYLSIKSKYICNNMCIHSRPRFSTTFLRLKTRFDMWSTRYTQNFLTMVSLYFYLRDGILSIVSSVHSNLINFIYLTYTKYGIQH